MDGLDLLLEGGALALLLKLHFDVGELQGKVENLEWNMRRILSRLLEEEVLKPQKRKK